MHHSSGLGCCQVDSICGLKGTRVSEEKEFSSSFARTLLDISAGTSVEADITCYQGTSQICQWIDSDPSVCFLRVPKLKPTDETTDMFTTLCTVTADTSQMAGSLEPILGLAGIEYYRMEFDVILQFGLTELKAFISWMENVSVNIAVPYFLAF